MKFALSMRVVENQTYVEPRDAISHDWIKFLTDAGHFPILVPNALPEPEGFLEACGADCLVLIGGDDPNGDILGRRGQSDRPATAPPLRDWTEARLLAFASATKLPVIGVCRGLETINLFFGGRITDDVRSATGEEHVAHPHGVRLSTPWLGRPAGTILQVNSYHQLGVLEPDLAKPLRSLARTPGGAVEAFVHRELPMTAVQWHPERPDSDRNFDLDLFRSCLHVNV